VPLISSALLVSLPFVAFADGVRPFLSGLFDPVEPQAIVLITALALLNAWAILMIACLVLTYGAKRFGLPERPCVVPPKPWSWVVASLLSSSLIVTTVRRVGATPEVGTLEAWLYAGLGAILALVLFLIALGINRLAHRVAARARPMGWYRRLLMQLARYPAIAEGFIAPGPTPRLEQGHAQAFGLLSASMLAYVGTGYLTSDIHRPQLASALAYVLLLQLVLTWLAGFGAFLFDRSRAPLFVYVAIWLLIVNWVLHPVWSTDHVYRTATMPQAPERLEPAALIGSSSSSIVVAASGGGIQSAAWTARVLTGLDALVPGFRARVRMISAVSGGSVGAMNVMASWADCGPPLELTETGVFDANAASRESSLHAVGWGLVFKDLPRTFVPMFSSPLVDRGSVLEDAWKREARLQRQLPSEGPLLASWRRNVEEGRCPGVVYNAMAAETGEPVLFPTIALPASLRTFDFYQRYPGRDLPVTTAVRLSAGFPYVSPASRADVDDELGHYTHVVDGGYFDNYGVSTLVSVVNAGLTNAVSPPQGRRVLVIEICDTAACSGADANPLVTAGGVDRAWTYQLRAPLSAVIAMRTSAQRVNNRAAIRLLRDYWQQRGVCVASIQAPFGGAEAPMSWHLTAAEKRAVDDEWNRTSVRSVESVRKFVTEGCG
jgi:predicted acylesterase/phospholipase RssA